MKITDLSANTDLLPLWPDEGDHGIYMRPMTQAQAKRLRAASKTSSRLHDLAAEAEEEAADAEWAGGEDAEELAARAEKAEAEAEAANSAFLDQLFDVVVDGRDQPLEHEPADRDQLSPTLIVRLLSRIEEVHAEMGKRGRSTRTARRGSGRKASSRTNSA